MRQRQTDPGDSLHFNVDPPGKAQMGIARGVLTRRTACRSERRALRRLRRRPRRSHTGGVGGRFIAAGGGAAVDG